MTVVQADGNDIEPITVDEFRISVAETYDVIVQPKADRAYTLFVQPEDRSGFARGTLAPRPGMAAPIPPMDPRPMRTMADMGMGSMDQGAMSGMDSMGTMPMNHGTMQHPSMPGMEQGSIQGMNHGSAEGMQMDHGSMSGMPGMEASPEAKKLEGSVGVDNVAMMPTERLNKAGEGFPPGRRVLTYADLRAVKPGSDTRRPTHEITLHLTGNMERFIWGFDGKKFSEAGPIELKRGDRVRFMLINDTMMEHPIHLHGLWSELENGHGEFRPYKHTINVKPGEKVTYLVTADEPGRWAYHCHLLYHMESGMFREVHVA
jgi:CopA family copper-resistance protein